jgi:hypothetical protein
MRGPAGFGRVRRARTGSAQSGSRMSPARSCQRVSAYGGGTVRARWRAVSLDTCPKPDLRDRFLEMGKVGSRD